MNAVKIEKFQDLLVWQRAHQPALATYRVTRAFPSEEKFGLVSQMRRAAVSIAATIAEGFVKRSQADKIHFYNTAQGSLEESKYYLVPAKDLGYLRGVDEEATLANEVGRLLNGLIRSIEH
ncbi:MAG: four helix bundle protein [Verrucomicrobiia bacterium]|jgi:four helix bundle protein